MRKTLLAAATTLTLLGVSAVQAQTTVIERRDDVVVDRPSTESKSVTVKEHGDGCVSKTVRKENDAGDTKTVKKETCD
ncbi:hypothetical protein [Methylobacterium haplocladii]|uniref:Secreted protein n=1 Tax=Methylobacterium haplocladii TaxID=1176176 RepID=A0A512INV9_9HYPH|nr:hypothetical protein [Methylobacterium haplocladii]GEO99387.1 hypothetical protein MHA02_17750 [Methylobacterium haplocladii]GJD83409.1 hypothetical protein HPGCJGGD_1275 [Methylobacterium haplocladii]GLS60265.1 hypothetical protein GCM10007887_29430 [Methylobacterium haplocladii]